MPDHRTEELALDDPRTTALTPPSGALDDVPASGEQVRPGSLADRDLIIRFQGDDLDAFEVFFERYRALIFRTAYGLTGDRQAAEEILQDTFLRAHRHRDSLRVDVSPVPWLHRVALNLCYSRLGRRKLPVEPIGETTHEVRDGGLGPDDQVEREELRRSIRTGIAALPPKHQSVIVLYYLHGLSLQETSAALGIALGTVKSRLHYALAGLRDQLAAERHLADPDVPGAQAGATPVSIVALGGTIERRARR
ncbi:MAG: RNA polymerase sigma factor [Chloroflexi bacterium]|nr:RNA polymerase sigma factor [Chloroflexota bacterium]